MVDNEDPVDQMLRELKRIANAMEGRAAADAPTTEQNQAIDEYETIEIGLAGPVDNYDRDDFPRVARRVLFEPERGPGNTEVLVTYQLAERFNADRGDQVEMRTVRFGNRAGGVDYYELDGRTLMAICTAPVDVRTGPVKVDVAVRFNDGQQPKMETVTSAKAFVAEPPADPAAQ